MCSFTVKNYISSEEMILRSFKHFKDYIMTDIFNISDIVNCEILEAKIN